MDENRKSQSPIAWVLGQTGDHGGQYVLSVILAVIGVAFSVAPYFVVVGIVQGLMDGQQDFAFYHLIARRPLPQFTSSTVDWSELRSLRVNREGMNCLHMFLSFTICERFTSSV